jgi:MFS transporter, DHA2 family, multidrug resistance protein
LINVLPGIVAGTLGLTCLPIEAPRFEEARKLDILSVLLMALALAALIIGLKEAPNRGWLSPPVVGLLAASCALTASFSLRTWRASYPVVEIKTFRDRWFCIGCLLSFVLGMGLYGTVYMMPVFLAATHGYGAFAIGKIMLVTGAAQLIIAPIAVEVERRVDPRLLSVAGFLLFALGLGLSAFQTVQTDYSEMFWPQVIRGAAIMFCLLPPTRMALGALSPLKVPDASGLFNLMRNLGGAIGLALIDTIVYGRAPGLGAQILRKLQAHDIETARSLGIPIGMLARSPRVIDPGTRAIIARLIERLAFVQAMNEAWAMLAVTTLAATISIAFARKPPIDHPF